MSRAQTDSGEATILEIQRMSTEDGPGIRTTVFFKGCSLQCSWCHNPESIARQPQLHWVGNRCIGCRTCLETCRHQVLTLTETGMVIDRTRCQACGDCAEACPSTALELMGKKWTLDDLVSEVIKDKAYFDRSGGGITISGGEPALQSEFATGFLRALKNRGIQTALDTCGLCSRKALESVLPFTTMVLFDLKILDPIKHQKLTGSSNEKILSNLLFTADFIKSHVHPKILWIRTPIIPGATDSEENIHAIGQYIAKNLSTLPERWELCAFNNLCQDKYHRLDIPWAFAEVELMRQSDMEHLADIARKSGVNPDMVHWSGSTRLESETVHNRPSLKAVNNCGIGS